MRSFHLRVGLPYAAIAAVPIVFGAVAVRQVTRTAARVEVLVAEHADRAIRSEAMLASSERTGRAVRGYLLTGDPRFRSDAAAAHRDFSRLATELRDDTHDEATASEIGAIAALEEEHYRAVQYVMGLRDRGGDVPAVAERLERDAQPLRDAVSVALAGLVRTERHLLDAARADAQARAASSANSLAIAAALALALAGIAAHRLWHAIRVLRTRERELEAANGELASVNADLDAFAGRVAHDLRNVLAPIGLALACLERAPDADAGAARRIRTTLERAGALIESLLGFARAGRPPDPCAAASVGEAIRGAAEATAAAAAEFGATVTVDVEDCVVACDPTLLLTVVANVLGNAIKFMADTPMREVRVRAVRRGDRCEIAVRDTGPGIPPGALPDVVKPFFRAPGVKANGVGLGLATVQRVADAYGGSLAIDAPPGEGTTVTVSLPLHGVVNAREAAGT